MQSQVFKNFNLRKQAITAKNIRFAVQKHNFGLVSINDKAIRGTESTYFIN